MPMTSLLTSPETKDSFTCLYWSAMIWRATRARTRFWLVRCLRMCLTELSSFDLTSYFWLMFLDWAFSFFRRLISCPHMFFYWMTAAFWHSTITPQARLFFSDPFLAGLASYWSGIVHQHFQSSSRPFPGPHSAVSSAHLQPPMSRSRISPHGDNFAGVLHWLAFGGTPI